MAARDNQALYRAFGNHLQDNGYGYRAASGDINTQIQDYFGQLNGMNFSQIAPDEQGAYQTWIGGPKELTTSDGWTYKTSDAKLAGRDVYAAYRPGELEKARQDPNYRAKAGFYDAQTGEFLYEQDMTSKADVNRGTKLGLLAVGGMFAAGAAGALGGVGGAGNIGATGAMEGVVGAGAPVGTNFGGAFAGMGPGGASGVPGNPFASGTPTSSSGVPGNPFLEGGGVPPVEAGAGGGGVPGNPFVEGGGAGSAAKGGILGTGMSAGDMLGAASTIAGAVGGAQGQRQGQTTTQKMDPRMDPYVFGTNGQGGLLNHANNLLNNQMSPGYLAQADHMRNLGMGLLNAPVRGNGFDYFMGRK